MDMTHLLIGCLFRAFVARCAFVYSVDSITQSLPLWLSEKTLFGLWQLANPSQIVSREKCGFGSWNIASALRSHGRVDDCWRISFCCMERAATLVHWDLIMQPMRQEQRINTCQTILIQSTMHCLPFSSYIVFFWEVPNIFRSSGG
jgi:hypothetical protein